MYRQIRGGLIICFREETVLKTCSGKSRETVQRTPKTKRLLGTWRIDSNLIRQIMRQASCGRRRKFRKHEMLYEQGTISSKFYLVLSGLVQVSIVRVDGVEVVLEYMGPETILGEGAAFDGLPKFSSAVAIEDADTIEFDAARMEEIFRQHPELFLPVAGHEPQAESPGRSTRTSGFASAGGENYGSAAPAAGDVCHRLSGGRLIVTHLTHEQISAMTGTSRVTVTRAMRSLRDQNEIDIIDGHIRESLAGQLKVQNFSHLYPRIQTGRFHTPNLEQQLGSSLDHFLCLSPSSRGPQRLKDKAQSYRRLFARFATGVAVVLTEEGDEIQGLTVNSLTSASLDPLLLLFCVSRSSRTGDAIIRTGSFTVNILNADQEDAARHFASRKDAQSNFEYGRDDSFVWLAHSNAVFHCRLEVSYPGGDHRIIIGRVENMSGPDECKHLLVYHEGHYVNLQSQAILNRDEARTS